MKLIKTLSIATCGLLFSFHHAMAQPALYKMKAKLEQSSQSTSARMNMVTPSQGGLLFSGNDLDRTNVRQWLAAQLEMRPGIDALTEEGPTTKAAGALEVNSYYQIYNGIKVEHGVVNSTTRHGKVAMMQLEFYSIPDNLSITPTISETSALHEALQEIGATRGLESQTAPTPGELVIIRTYDDDSTVCLAWKFEVYNSQPLAYAKVYINAQTGKLVLRDDIIKHVNAVGTAETRYSSTQSIVTDNGSADPAKPFRLRQTRNGVQIITLNYQKRKPTGGNDTLAVDFTDNDNNWTAIEHYNLQNDDVALDVQFNMQIISDYWKVVHSRNGWDNKFANYKSNVHVSNDCNGTIEPLDNAYWSGSAMYFGDGSRGAPVGVYNCTSSHPFRPLTPLDVTAHEVGHGITQSTNRLIYRWESGALDEGLSDIWAAVIEQWGKILLPTINTGKDTWLIAEEISDTLGKGIRNMKNPDAFKHPSTYKGPHWRPASYPGCQQTNNNDHCGVHANSNVLNKWFFLITDGEAGTNTLNQPYNVAGMGFSKSRNLAYMLSLNLTPNATYATANAVSMEAATTLFGAGSTEVETVRSAWRAVGVDSAIWTMDNTPLFAANNVQGFLTIGMGEDKLLWAGTDKKGLYVFNDTVWTKRSELTNVRINDIDADQNGGIWIAQSGTVNSGLATAGGVNYFADAAAPMTSTYTIGLQSNVPTRNVRSLFVDKTRLNAGNNPRVWIGCHTYTNSTGNAVSGKPGLGLNSATPFFTTITAGMQTANTATGITAIGGGKDTVWAFAPGNNGKNQILAYSASTAAFLTSYDNSTDPIIPANINVTAIYTDRNKRTWFGLTTNAVLVSDEKKFWHYIHFPGSFLAGSQVNANAITGSAGGNVYIGTTAGLVFFDAYTGDMNLIDDSTSYRIFQKQHGLPSNNVTGIVYDKERFRLWVATDQGICRWDPLCLGGSCDVNGGYLTQTHSIASGNWSDTAIWEEGHIPDSTTEVVLEHDIVIDINADCYSLKVFTGGSAHLNPGINLKILQKPDDLIPGIGRRRGTRTK